MNYKKRSELLLKRIDLLNKYSDKDTRLERSLASAAQKELMVTLKKIMETIGLEVWTDHIGNLRGRLTSHNPEAKYVYIGGYTDTVEKAGKYDGIISILLGLSLVEKLLDDNKDYPFHIEIIAFIDGANTYFDIPYLGCRSLTGTFNLEWLNKKNDNGQTLKSLLQIYGNPTSVLHDMISVQNTECYFQFALDHTDLLDKEMVSVGIFEGINSSSHLHISITPNYSHQAMYLIDTPNYLLYAFTQFIKDIEYYIKRRGEWLYSKINNINFLQEEEKGQTTKIVFDFNLFSKDNKLVTIAYETLKNQFIKLAKTYKTTINIDVLNKHKSILPNPKLSSLLADCIENSGIDIKRLSSFENQSISILAPYIKTCMLFIRTQKGIYQQQDEYIRIEDIMVAIKIGDKFLDKLVKYNGYTA